MSGENYEEIGYWNKLDLLKQLPKFWAWIHVCVEERLDYYVLKIWCLTILSSIVNTIVQTYIVPI